MFFLPFRQVTRLPRRAGIYALVEAATGRVYVGRATNLYSRVRTHIWRAKSDHPRHDEKGEYLYRAMRTRKSQWLVCVVEELEDMEKAADREAFWIDFFEANVRGCGFNLAPPTKYVAPSDEHRRNLSRALRGKPKSLEHRANMSKARRGVKLGPLSAEQKEQWSRRAKARVASGGFEANLAKLRAANTGRVKSAEEIEKIRQAHLGKKLTEEHKAKISAAHRGKKRGPRDPATVEKVRQGNLGKKRTPEQCRAMSEARKGVPRRAPMTDEHRRKLSIAALKWRAERREGRGRYAS
jgi:group I intron endonuclease